MVETETCVTFWLKTLVEEIVWETYVKKRINMDLDKIGFEHVNWVKFSLERNNLL
jgi:hypothetical protein